MSQENRTHGSKAALELNVVCICSNCRKNDTVRNQYVVFGNKSLNEIALNFKEKIVSTHVQ